MAEPAPILIEATEPTVDDVAQLVETHLDFARRVTPPEDVHAVDVDGLLDPTVTVFAARRGGELVGIGALRELDARHGEIKSMHTLESARGEGVGRAMVDHLVEVARTRGYHRISLETGTMEPFAASRALYQSCGFEECEPFGEHRVRAVSVCMTRQLR